MAGWALVSVAVALALNAARQRGGSAGNLLGSLGATAVVAGAIRGVFGVALYRFSIADRAIGPFERSELATAAS